MSTNSEGFGRRNSLVKRPDLLEQISQALNTAFKLVEAKAASVVAPQSSSQEPTNLSRCSSAMFGEPFRANIALQNIRSFNEGSGLVVALKS